MRALLMPDLFWRTLAFSKGIEHVALGTWVLSSGRHDSEDENLCFWARTEKVSCWADPCLLPAWDLKASEISKQKAPGLAWSLLQASELKSHVQETNVPVSWPNPSLPLKMWLSDWEKVWANRLCNSVHRCPGVTEEPEQHPWTWWMCVGTRLRWKEELNIGKLLPRKQTWETFCVLAECQCESRPPLSPKHTAQFSSVPDERLASWNNRGNFCDHGS